MIIGTRYWVILVRAAAMPRDAICYIISRNRSSITSLTDHDQYIIFVARSIDHGVIEYFMLITFSHDAAISQIPHHVMMH